jgi:glucose dehydrogenase
MKNVYVISLFFILFSCSDSNINWSSYGNDIQNQRFSEIDEINISNVDQLKLVWLKRTGINSTFQATPITDDGVMYVSLPFNHIIAIDILSGEELWRYKHTKKRRLANVLWSSQ